MGVIGLSAYIYYTPIRNKIKKSFGDFHLCYLRSFPQPIADSKCNLVLQTVFARVVFQSPLRIRYVGTLLLYGGLSPVQQGWQFSTSTEVAPHAHAHAGAGAQVGTTPRTHTRARICAGESPPLLIKSYSSRTHARRWGETLQIIHFMLLFTAVFKV